MKRFFATAVSSALLLLTATGLAPQLAAASPDGPRPPPAYQVLAERKAAVESELKEVSKILAAQHPDVESKVFELSTIGEEMERVSAAEESVARKLTEAYGKLVLRKVRLRVQLRGLERVFAPEHPDVKTKRAELDALERETEAAICWRPAAGLPANPTLDTRRQTNYRAASVGLPPEGGNTEPRRRPRTATHALPTRSNLLAASAAGSLKGTLNSPAGRTRP